MCRSTPTTSWLHPKKTNTISDTGAPKSEDASLGQSSEEEEKGEGKGKREITTRFWLFLFLFSTTVRLRSVKSVSLINFNSFVSGVVPLFSLWTLLEPSCRFLMSGGLCFVLLSGHISLMVAE